MSDLSRERFSYQRQRKLYWDLFILRWHLVALNEGALDFSQAFQANIGLSIGHDGTV